VSLGEKKVQAKSKKILRAVYGHSEIVIDRICLLFTKRAVVQIAITPACDGDCEISHVIDLYRTAWSEAGHSRVMEFNLSDPAPCFYYVIEGASPAMTNIGAVDAGEALFGSCPSSV